MSWLSSAIGTVVLGGVMGVLGGLGVQWFFHWRRRSENRRALITGLLSEISAHVIMELSTPGEDPRRFGVGFFSGGVFDVYLRDIPDLLPRRLATKVLRYYPLMAEARRLQDSYIKRTASELARLGDAPEELPTAMSLAAAQLMRMIQADKDGCSWATAAAIPLRHEILSDLKERVSHSSGSNSYMIAAWRKLSRYLPDRFFN